MEITEKNKQEIEKIEQGCGKRDSWLSQDIRNCGDEFSDLNKVFRKYLCQNCKKKLESTIKTSIEWCEDEIEFINEVEESLDDIFRTKEYKGKTYGVLKLKKNKITSHLKWLKENE